MSSSQHILLFLTSISIHTINSQIVTCTGGECNCPLTISGTPCLLDCSREDICKEQTLNCRPNDPCFVLCTNKASCSSGTTINANLATTLTITCSFEDACKSDTTFSCGTGDCQLECIGLGSCLELGPIDTTMAKSFLCIGDGCLAALPFLPPQFQPTPTTSPTRPTSNPSTAPTSSPSQPPTFSPTDNPSFAPISPPSNSPTISPSFSPTITPTLAPSYSPSISPSFAPTMKPTPSPTFGPTFPTNIPTMSPTRNPSRNPTFYPTSDPTNYPTIDPTINPTINPSTNPTISPSKNPSSTPTRTPSMNPTKSPTNAPTSNPTPAPTKNPSFSPTFIPTDLTQNPSSQPTVQPTAQTIDFDTEEISSEEDVFAAVDDSEKSGKAKLVTTLLMTGVGLLLIAICFATGFILWSYRKKTGDTLKKLKTLHSTKTRSMEDRADSNISHDNIETFTIKDDKETLTKQMIENIDPNKLGSIIQILEDSMHGNNQQNTMANAGEAEPQNVVLERADSDGDITTEMIMNKKKYKQEIKEMEVTADHYTLQPPINMMRYASGDKDKDNEDKKELLPPMAFGIQPQIELVGCDGNNNDDKNGRNDERKKVKNAENERLKNNGIIAMPTPNIDEIDPEVMKKFMKQRKEIMELCKEISERDPNGTFGNLKGIELLQFNGSQDFQFKI